MPDVTRTVRFVTEQKTNANKEPVDTGFPMRNWHIEIYLVNETDQSAIPATVFEKVQYKLHESFGKRANQVIKKPPFRCQEEGWGEFDMTIILYTLGKGGEHVLSHDLNFAQERYEADHIITFKNPKPELMALLRESGPVPGDENGVPKASKVDATKKKSRGGNKIDMEKLAEGLEKLGEDDLLQVVQMVHDHKTPETYTKNDFENGEFHVDLYTLPDPLVKMLWDFTAQRAESIGNAKSENQSTCTLVLRNGS